MDLGIQAQDLMTKWKKARTEYDYFVTDGILNYNCYIHQSPKIIFLLKESNADFVNIAPLSQDIIGYGPKGNSNLFWRYMRGYEYIINSAWKGLAYDEYELLKTKEKPNNNSAYVNIKKQCENKSKSNNLEIEFYALQDKDFLKEQIEIINPNVIYCAGTFSSYRLIDKEINELSTRVYESNNRIIIDYFHLAHRRGY